MVDDRPQADRILVAQLTGEARHRAKWRPLRSDEEDQAVAELATLAGGRADLLAQVAGIFEGASEGELDEPLARCAARLCRLAGADPEKIPAWIEEGRRRRAAARKAPRPGEYAGYRRKAWGVRMPRRSHSRRRASAVSRKTLRFLRECTSARRVTRRRAMAQSEEQFSAARAVTAATRPLNLYYGLAQAGMAIAAAHAPDPWSFSRHGLHLGDRNPELADMTVGPSGEGGFQKVATATGSPGITTPVSLGTLWASLPDLAEAGTLPGPAWHLPLELSEATVPGSWPRATLYLPGEMPEDPDAWMTAFSSMMADYPSAAGYRIPIEHGVPQISHAGGRQWEVTLRWPAEESSGKASDEEIKTFLGKNAPEYRYRGDRFLRPSVDGTGGEPPSPLMTWWILLFSFSNLARYEPRRWAHLLDLDTSRVAVLLRFALEEALTAVPQLVLEALDQQPFLLAKPLAF